ncbi:hypothetical protein VSS74_25680 [Conexibacter stalactiti]|uniref:DUF11 domain-containing protein n=1 Tax=Conexibacter stalactiti TaxID=1940611 RepID=A0ABU4I0B6_9ACTN|nr:hypothetical protein [Conexibacter stalactiti]MDW5597769.1 hypothetical protein [Conexibacter stalactiti]MEC5038411.1 hypothetical protein [Conexibacter stalactiti]
MTAEGRPPAVLQTFTVTVEPGGSAGLVRLRASDPHVDPARGVVLGDWVMLPAEPGRYTFPAPRILMDYRSVVLALDQQTGGHAIVAQDPCTPERGEMADPCQLTSLDTWTPILPDGVGAAPPESRRGDPPPTSRQPGQRLQIHETSEFDRDGDLAGDTTEDRTDLALQADAVRGRDGRLTITVTNRGPRVADWPRLEIDRERVSGWEPACVTTPLPQFTWPHVGGGGCRLPALAPGASQTISLPTIDDGRAIVVSAAAEGPDLVPADNTVSVVPRLGAAPAASLTVPARVRATTRGVRVRLSSAVASTATLRFEVRYRGSLRRVTRRLALRAGVVRTPALRLARVRGAFPTGRAQLTVTVTAPASETRTLRRQVRLVRQPESVLAP